MPKRNNFKWGNVDLVHGFRVFRSQATWFSGLYGCGEQECHDASVGIRKVLLTWWPRGKEKWRRKPESLVLQWLLEIHLLEFPEPSSSTIGRESSLSHKGLRGEIPIQIIACRSVGPISWGLDVLWPQRPFAGAYSSGRGRQGNLRSKQNLQQVPKERFHLEEAGPLGR